MNRMRIALAFSILLFSRVGLDAQKLSEKFKEKPVTKDTFLDKNRNGINDLIETKKKGRSLFKDIIEGINSREEKRKESSFPKPKLKKKKNSKERKPTQERLKPFRKSKKSPR